MGQSGEDWSDVLKQRCVQGKTHFLSIQDMFDVFERFQISIASFLSLKSHMKFQRRVWELVR